MAREMDNTKYEYDEEFILNSRGLKLFTCRWKLKNEEPKALIFLLHGYAMECSITLHSTAIRLAEAGFCVYGMDYEGHGKSAGLDAYINKFDDIVEDCHNHFTNVCEKPENKHKMRFVMGESMGSTVALLLTMKNPDYWDGAILVAPMCKIADDLKPSHFVTNILTHLCRYVPTWKLIPGQDIVEIAFKDRRVRKQVRENPYCYKGRPRLKTGFELLRVCMALQNKLHEITVPFIVLHGAEDRVVDKDASRHLHETASSKDKTFKLYPKMWHGLLYGEPAENRDMVFEDIIDWVDERVSLNYSRLEKDYKYENESILIKSVNNQSD